MAEDGGNAIDSVAGPPMMTTLQLALTFGAIAIPTAVLAAKYLFVRKQEVSNEMLLGGREEEYSCKRVGCDEMEVVKSASWPRDWHHTRNSSTTIEIARGLGGAAALLVQRLRPPERAQHAQLRHHRRRPASPPATPTERGLVLRARWAVVTAAVAALHRHDRSTLPMYIFS